MFDRLRRTTDLKRDFVGAAKDLLDVVELRFEEHQPLIEIKGILIRPKTS